VLLIEAVIAAPIWAAAHSIPDGGGSAINQHARAGYMILLSLFMRPTLMIFGLFASMILIIILGKIVSVTFLPMVGSVSAGSWQGLIAVILYLVIFTSLMVSLAHRAFGLIHEIPDKILRYIGGGMEVLGEAPNESATRHTFIAGGAKVVNQASTAGAASSKSRSQDDQKLASNNEPSNKSKSQRTSELSTRTA
jgi:hypothetical protein